MAEDTAKAEGTEEAAPTPDQDFDAGWEEDAVAEATAAASDNAAPTPEPEADPAGATAPAPAEGAPASKEGEEPAPESVEPVEPVAVPDPKEARVQAQRSQLGRITAHRRGLDRMEQDYRTKHGSLPTDETEAQQVERLAREAQIKEVDTKLPEVRAAIDEAVRAAEERILGRVDAGTSAGFDNLEDRMHFEQIASSHADFEDYLPPEEGQQGHEKQQALLTWIRGQPYAVGDALMAVYEHGYPDEVNMMLSAFKEDAESTKGSGVQQPGVPSPRREEQARNAEAVPAGNTGLPRGQGGLPADANLDEAWAYFEAEEQREAAAEANAQVAGRTL